MSHAVNHETPRDAEPPRLRIVDQSPMWVALPDSVLFDPELHATDVRVYAVLKRYALRYGDDSVFPSQGHIALNASCSRYRANEALATLERRGHIERQSGGFGKADIITICAPTPREWSFNPEPQESGRQGHRSNRRAQLSEKTTTGVSCQKKPQLVSGNLTTGVRKVDTINRRDEREEKEREDSSNDAPQILDVSAHDSPYALWSAFNRAVGLDSSAASEPGKEKHLAVAKRLLGKYRATVDEVLECAAYLQSQSWRRDIPTLFSIEAEIDKWRMAGRPASGSEPRNSRPQQHSPMELFHHAEQLREAGR